MDERVGFRIFHERFTRYLENHPNEVWMALAPFYLPLSLLEETVKVPSPWRTYIATEAGAMHARCLAERDANPDAVITPEQAQVIVRPLIDLARAAPVGGLEERIAQYWITHEQGSAEGLTVLRFFIAVARRNAVFYRAVNSIARHRLRSGEPLGAELCWWLSSVLEGKRPAGVSGRPKEMLRDRYIFVALLVLQHLGLTPATADGPARDRSGCGIVADGLDLSYAAVATVWRSQRRELGMPVRSPRSS